MFHTSKQKYCLIFLKLGSRKKIGASFSKNIFDLITAISELPSNFFCLAEGLDIEFVKFLSFTEIEDNDCKSILKMKLI